MAHESTEAHRLAIPTIIDNSQVAIYIHIQVGFMTLSKMQEMFNFIIHFRSTVSSRLSPYVSRWLKQHLPAIHRICDLFGKDKQLKHGL